MTTEYSGVAYIKQGDGILDYDFIEVDVTTGHLWWKKTERIQLCSMNSIDWTYPETGEWVLDNTHGLYAAVKLCTISQIEVPEQ